MEMVHINGTMENFIMDSGNKGKCKEMENIIHLLDLYIKVSLKTIKNMEKVKIFTD